jgi:hypothetical protein
MRISKLLLALSLLFAWVPIVEADEIYTFVVKKQEEKKQTRAGWNLADWMTQRDRRRTQDLWLAMNTPTPYEFSLGGDYRFLNEPKDERDHRFSMTAYAKIFGLKLEKETEPGRWNGMLNIRLFGLHQQGTNLTVFGGIRSQEGTEDFRSAIYGASVTIYLMRLAGTEFEYRRYTEGTANPGGAGAAGNQTEANFFIDFSFLRLYGGFLRTDTDPGRDKGYQGGAKIFF